MKIPHTMKLLLALAILINVIIATAQAQLTATTSPVKIVGQKATVELAMTNNLPYAVESARATCFLLNNQGEMIGQSSKWVIGGTKDRPSLPAKAGTGYNFVITTPQPLAAANITAKVSFSSVVLSGGRLADVTKDVSVKAETRQ